MELRIPEIWFMLTLGTARPPPTGMFDWKVDYAKSVSQVHTMFAVATILETSSLYILCLVSNIDPSLRNSGIPSWVPDWSIWNISQLEEEDIASISRRQYDISYTCKLLGEYFLFFSSVSNKATQLSIDFDDIQVPMRLALRGIIQERYRGRY